MGFPINTEDIKDIINNSENFSNNVFISESFYFAKVCFSLLATIEDFINECEKTPNTFIVGNKLLWIEFMTIYYEKLNVSRNTLKSSVKGDIARDKDIEDIKDNIRWCIETVSTIIKDDGVSPIHIVNIYFACRFYTGLHYYISCIDSYCTKKFNLIKDFIQCHRTLKIAEEERFWIDSLQQDIEQKITTGQDVSLEPELKNKLINSWDRSLNFISQELKPEFLPTSIH